MANKKVTLLFYGADRELWTGGSATLTITKVEPGNAVEIHRQRVKPGTSALEVVLKDAEFDNDIGYLFVVTAGKHRDAWFAISHNTFLRPSAGSTVVEVDECILRLLLVPKKTQPIDLPEAYALMLEAASNFVTKPGLSPEAYKAVSAEQGMALLNVEAKLRSTRVEGTPLLSFVEEILQVKVDRVFLRMNAEAKRMVGRSGDFVSAPGHLPAHPDSWKHKAYPTGNIQLCFSREPENLRGAMVYSVDVDIDLERGARHIIEWLDNNVFGKNKTDQTRVYSLLYGQGITPYYKLSPLTVL